MLSYIGSGRSEVTGGDDGEASGGPARPAARVGPQPERTPRAKHTLGDDLYDKRCRPAVYRASVGAGRPDLAA
jgi:hypothetical protein